MTLLISVPTCPFLGNMYYKGKIDYQSLVVAIRNVVYDNPTLVLIQVISRMWLFLDKTDLLRNSVLNHT